MSTHGNGPAGVATDQDARRTLRGTTANYLAALFQLLLFAFHVLAARFFGRSAYGAYIYAWSLVEMACKVGVLGMDKGMLRAVAVASAKGDRDAEARFAATGLAVAGLSSLVVVGVLWVIASRQEVSEYRSALFTLAPVVLTWSLGLVLVCATMATGTMHYNLLVRGLCEPVAMVVAVLVLGIALAGLAEQGIALAHLASSSCAFLLAIWAFGRRLDRPTALRALTSGSWNWSLVRFTFPIMLAELLNQAIYRLDIVFLGLLMKDGPTAVAGYGAAVLIAGVLSSVRYAFDPVLSPVAAACADEKDTARLALNLTRMTRWVLGLSWPLFSTLLVFGDFFLGLWGPEYGNAHAVLVVLCVAHLVNAVLGLHQWPVVMSGRSPLDLLNNVAGFLVIVVANLLLIPALGPLGAALATLLGNVVFRGLQVLEVHSIFRVGPFNRSFLWLGVAGTFSLAVQLAIRAVVAEPGWTTVAISAICGVAIVGTLYLWKAAPEDRELVFAVRRWLRGESGSSDSGSSPFGPEKPIPSRGLDRLPGDSHRVREAKNGRKGSNQDE